MPQIPQVSPAIAAISCEIATITSEIAFVTPQLSLVTILDVIPNLSLITSQLVAVGANLSRILSKLATIHLRAIVIPAPAHDGVSSGGSLS